MRRTLLALSFACLATPALAVDFEMNSNGSIDFDMPSGNICCSFVNHETDGPLLQCTRVKPKYWIVQLSMDGELSVNKNPGEVPGCGYGAPLGNIFEYGTSWTEGPFKCTSSTSGVKCLAHGRGFKLSKAGLKQY
jgi:hypothetical protein